MIVSIAMAISQIRVLLRHQLESLVGLEILSCLHQLLEIGLFAPHQSSTMIPS
jgi:hypothetical protein